MQQHNDLSHSLLLLEQDSTLIAVIEMSRSSWLAAALVPGHGRHPLKKTNPVEIAKRRTQLIKQKLERLQFEFDTVRDSYRSIAARCTLRARRWLRQDYGETPPQLAPMCIPRVGGLTSARWTSRAPLRRVSRSPFT
jgi:hypothetical protein